MNLIQFRLIEGKPTFWGLTDVPEIPREPKRHWTKTGEWELFENKILPNYQEKVSKCEQKALRIENHEEFIRKLYENDSRITGPMSFDAWQRVVLKHNDTFEVPEGFRLVEENCCLSDCCPVDGRCEHCIEPAKMIRLVPIKEESFSDHILKFSTTNSIAKAMFEKKPDNDIHMDSLNEGERFYNENYSGTEMSELLKPYITNSYIAGKRSVNTEEIDNLTAIIAKHVSRIQKLEAENSELKSEIDNEVLLKNKQFNEGIEAALKALLTLDIASGTVHDSDVYIKIEKLKR